MRIGFIVILSFITFFGFAQGQVQITGTVTDQASGEPLEFATVSILDQSDSSLVTGDVTNAQGKFTISASAGNYILKSQFIAYSPKFRNINAQDDRNIGTISLSQDVETLGEVVVTGQKDQMQLELDKRVFNVSENINNIGANAAQIMDNLPSISVDVDGNVSLRGSQNVRILINGRPSGLVGLSSTDALRQLQGNLIERIEVVTNPSARYDAEGSAGVINIVLKKKRESGFNGAFTINTGWPHDHGLSANANYRQDWFNVFLNYGINYDENPGGGFSHQQFFFPDTSYQTLVDRDRIRGGLSNTLRFGSEFFINSNTTLTAALMMRVSDEENNSTITYEDISQAGNLVNNSQRLDTEIEEDDVYEVELSFLRDFKGEGHKLTADFQYRINDETEDSDIVELDFLNGGEFLNQQRSLNNEGNTNIMFQADYINPFGEGKKFEAGYRGTMQEITSDYLVESLEDGVWVNLENFTNEFLYDEQVHAAYAIYENKMDRWGYQLGLRAEQTDIETFQRQTDDRNTKSYLNLFPSAFVSYKLSDEHSFQASYSRRLSRPRHWYLNPFFSFSDPRNIRTGNVDLDPEYTDSYEAGYLNNKETYSFYFGGYHRHTTGVIERVRFVNEEAITFTIPQNLSVENAYGVEMNFSADPVKWFNLNGNANFYRAITEGSFNDINLDRDTYTANFRLNTRFALGKYSLQVSGRYSAPQESTQGTQKARYSVDLGANRDILKNKGTLTLSVRDLFNTRKYRGTSEGEFFIQESEFQWRSRQVNLSFTYRINQKKERGRRDRGRGDYGGGEDMDF